MPSSKTPRQIMEEAWKYQVTSNLDAPPDWLRSSMQSLLLHVMEGIPLKAVPLPGKSLRKVNLGYNEAISDCLAVIQSTIDSIKE